MPNKSNQDENLLDASDSKLILRMLEQSSLVQIDEEEAGGSGSKKERYFWQYNVQAKGPKGQVIQFGQIDRKQNWSGTNWMQNMCCCRNSPLTQRSTTLTSWTRSSTPSSATMSPSTGSSTGWCEYVWCTCTWRPTFDSPVLTSKCSFLIANKCGTSVKCVL